MDKFGRSYEAGLATGYHLLKRWKPLEMVKMGPMGMQDVFPRADGDSAHQNPPDRAASGHYQESQGTERGGTAGREEPANGMQPATTPAPTLDTRISTLDDLMKYAYYPGCSLECNAAAYDHSVREVADLLDIKLQTLDDWNCCGATEYFSQDELTASR